MTQFCKVCGKPEFEHHEFQPGKLMPFGCKCDPFDWGQKVVPVCGDYKEDPKNTSRCINCEHDKECHKL